MALTPLHRWKRIRHYPFRQLLSRLRTIHILVFFVTLATTNELFIRYTSRSLHAPTTNAIYTLKRFPPQESPNAGIQKISSTDYQAVGIGPLRQQITGVTILKFLFYMATALIARWPLTIRNLQNRSRQCQHLLHWRAKFRSY